VAQKKKIRLKGHETFILREGWLTKGLLEVAENSKVFSENYGADALGVGSNMAKAIRYWLRESGLIVEPPKMGALLTDLGKVILDKDAYFEDDFSLWLIHCNLVMNAEKVTSWYAFFNLLESEEFTREELERELTDKILLYSAEESVPERSVKDDCNAILSMYFRENEKDYDPEEKRVSPFAHLGLVRKNLNRYKKVMPNLNTVSMDVILYVLAKYIERTGEKNISIDDLVNGENLPGKVLNLNRTVLNKYLDELADENCLTVNRTAGLDMVYLDDISSYDVVARHYEKG